MEQYDAPTGIRFFVRSSVSRRCCFQSELIFGDGRHRSGQFPFHSMLGRQDRYASLSSNYRTLQDFKGPLDARWKGARRSLGHLVEVFDILSDKAAKEL